jgi:hypothetical protein
MTIGKITNSAAIDMRKKFLEEVIMLIKILQKICCSFEPVSSSLKQFCSVPVSEKYFLQYDNSR